MQLKKNTALLASFVTALVLSSLSHSETADIKFYKDASASIPASNPDKYLDPIKIQFDWTTPNKETPIYWRTTRLSPQGKEQKCSDVNGCEFIWYDYFNILNGTQSEYPSVIQSTDTPAGLHELALVMTKANISFTPPVVVFFSSEDVESDAEFEQGEELYVDYEPGLSVINELYSPVFNGNENTWVEYTIDEENSDFGVAELENSDGTEPAVTIKKPGRVTVQATHYSKKADMEMNISAGVRDTMDFSVVEGNEYMFFEPTVRKYELIIGNPNN